MPESWRRRLALAPVLIFAGCAIYREKPLDPEAELLALGRSGLEGFVVEHVRPGGGKDASQAPFDLSDGLDEAELVAVALTANPDLKARRLAIGEARALLVSAGLWPNPEIGVGWRPGISPPTGFTADAELLLEVLKPGERSARKQVAVQRIEQERQAIAAEEWRLATQARTARLRVLFAQDAFRLLERETALREQAMDLVRRRRQIGEATELDASVAALELSQARGEMRRERADLECRRAALNRLLGLPPGHVLNIQEARPIRIGLYEDLPEEDLEKRLLQGRPELREMEAAYGRSEAELRLAILGQYPKLKIGPSYGKEADGGNFLGVGASLEIPLFDRNQGGIAAKEALRERARAEYTALLHRLVADAHEALRELRLAGQEVEAGEREVLPIIRAGRDLLEKALRARELNLLDWAAAQERFLRMEREHLRTLLEYQTAVVRMETVLGR